MSNREQFEADGDEQDENQYGDWYERDSDGEEDEGFTGWGNEPDIDKLVEERVTAFETALVDAIERGDTGNKVYKGLQRRLNERFDENKTLKEQLSYLANKILELETNQSELGTTSEWQKEILMSALDEQDRGVALGKFDEIKKGKETKQLEQFVQALMSGKIQLPQQQTQQYQPPVDNDLEAKIQEAKRKFIESKKSYAKTFGVDPESKDLDFGSDDDSFFERQEKFDRSLLAIINSDKKINNLTGKRQGVTGVPAYSGEPSTSSDPDQALIKAANDRIRKYLG